MLIISAESEQEIQNEMQFAKANNNKICIVVINHSTQEQEAHEIL